MIDALSLGLGASGLYKPGVHLEADPVHTVLLGRLYWNIWNTFFYFCLDSQILKIHF